jgi:hypothetical protein
MTNATEITNETVVAVAEKSSKYPLTPAQKRQLQIRISDFASTVDMYNDDTMNDYFTRLGHLTAMAAGMVPFEAMDSVNATPIQEKRTKDTKTYTAFFFAPASHLREAKVALQRNLQLLHLPHAMNVSDQPGMRRFRVNDTTKEAAHTVYNRNAHIFTALTFSDENREETGLKEETTLPQSASEVTQVVPETALTIEDAFVSDEHEEVQIEATSAQIEIEEILNEEEEEETTEE